MRLLPWVFIGREWNCLSQISGGNSSRMHGIEWIFSGLGLESSTHFPNGLGIEQPLTCHGDLGIASSFKCHGELGIASSLKWACLSQKSGGKQQGKPTALSCFGGLGMVLSGVLVNPSRNLSLLATCICFTIFLACS